MPQPVVGCDLSRAFLDLCHLPAGDIGQIANTPEAIVAWIDTPGRDVLIVFGATGGCDGDLIAALAERGPMARVGATASVRSGPPNGVTRNAGPVAVVFCGLKDFRRIAAL